MMISDYGIVLEIAGFALLLFSGNRNPSAGAILWNSHKEDPFDVFRSKILPDKWVHQGLVTGIVIVIIGLILQISNFNFII